ncbi:Crp/Fnr family transcriptional regulator [Chitinophaga sancti]|uniref:Crp/Fnr family transcriptional regulator n=1 Tax=Chitinophaga sancti TaxID=1004 RepID=UPI002A75CC6A|nr:Crp/Fnr family transcriptional regulator [Chitinophaga sancti]WPQ62544.1 Crp/Fnr family transcriptional regulator [Chitinophaga sancti]
MNRLRLHIEEITPINDEEFEFIKSFFTLKRVRKNQYLIQEGDDVKYEYLVLSGIYRVFYSDDQGREYVCMFAQENWWMSDYNSYFNQKPASMYLECLVPGEVLCLSLYGREKLAAELHKMEHFFRMKMTRGFIALQLRIKMLLCNAPQKRYEEFAKLYPVLIQQIPKKMIAEFLGLRRETLSRLYTNHK